MVEIKSKGSFDKTFKFLDGVNKIPINKILEKYGKLGVEILASNTPKNSGNTANSWSYTIGGTNKNKTISWTNSSVNKGIPIVILLQYGHATNNGGYVQGVDFINPSLKKVFDDITDAVWKEVTRL